MSSLVDALAGAGVERARVEADYDNVDELLDGGLGPFPI